MTATISTLRSGLAANLGMISGLQVYENWPDSLVTPCVIIRPTTGTYHEAMGSPGFQSVTFELTVLANATQKGLEIGQPLLDDYLDLTSSKSIKAAVEADVTLGGASDTLIVTGWTNYGELEIAGIGYLGAVLTVTVDPEVS